MYNIINTDSHTVSNTLQGILPNNMSVHTMLDALLVKHYQGDRYIRQNWFKFHFRQTKRLLKFNLKCINCLKSIQSSNYNDANVYINDYIKTLKTMKKIEEEGFKRV